MKLSADIACASCRGKVRSNNEDNLLFEGKILDVGGGDLWPPQSAAHRLTEKPLLAALFDGMGGEENGEEASFAAAKSLREIAACRELDANSLFRVSREMNAVVFARGRELMSSRMGTTMAMLLLGETETVVANLGDSPIYVLRGGKLHKVSRDHTDAEEMQRRGITNRKPYLTQYLGIDPEELLIEPYVARVKTTPRDRILLCSDGLTDMVPEQEIAAMLGSAATAADAVAVLTNAALNNGGRDNVTVLVAIVK